MESVASNVAILLLFLALVFTYFGELYAVLPILNEFKILSRYSPNPSP